MLVRFLESCVSIPKQYGQNPAAASAILDDLYAPPLKVYGVGRIVVVDQTRVVLTVRGRLQSTGQPPVAFLKAKPQILEIRTDLLASLDRDGAARTLEQHLARYLLEGDGAWVWIVPDGYLAALSEREKVWERDGGGYFSHESLCVQNTGAWPTRCELFVYFEAPGREVLRHCFDVPPQRSIHLRLDKLRSADGGGLIPKNAPVGYKLVSRDAPVVVQGSRILTSGQDSEFASFGTTMGWMAG